MPRFTVPTATIVKKKEEDNNNSRQLTGVFLSFLIARSTKEKNGMLHLLFMLENARVTPPNEGVLWVLTNQKKMRREGVFM